MAKLTKRVVDQSGPADTEFFVWDSELRGLGLRVSPAGRKSFLVQYRFNGKTRRQGLGVHGVTTVEQARTLALSVLSDVAAGIDPRAAPKPLTANLTVAELCDAYLRDGVELKKESTLATDRGRIERHIKPLLGRMTASDVQRSDIEKFVRDVTAGKTAIEVKTKLHGKARVKGGGGTAARTVGLLGAIFTFAINSLSLRRDNPVLGINKRKDARRVRFLSTAEATALGEAFSALERRGGNPFPLAAIKLLLLTGARKSEILSAKWQYVDFERSQMRLPDSKTGEKTIHVPAQGIALLRRLPRKAKSEYLFPSNRTNGHFVGLQKVWSELRAEAGLADLHIHDLRHIFATMAAAEGHSLLTIGHMLGHRDPRTTQIYAHVVDAALSQAVQQTGDRIERMLSASGEGAASDGK